MLLEDAWSEAEEVSAEAAGERPESGSKVELGLIEWRAVVEELTLNADWGGLCSSHVVFEVPEELVEFARDADEVVVSVEAALEKVTPTDVELSPPIVRFELFHDKRVLLVAGGVPKV